MPEPITKDRYGLRDRRAAAAAKLTYFLLRIVAGLLFFQAGAATLFGWFRLSPDPEPLHLMSQQGIGGILEFAGGLAIMAGLFTRPVAFVLSGVMAVAYWQFHAPHGTWPIENEGMAAVLFSFLFLFMAARGAGDWSLDAVLFHAKRANSLENDSD
ncbi:MAG TPA: DoxX family protein [Blastocatellia bacterium]